MSKNTTKVSKTEIEEMCRKLKLSDIRENYEDIIAEAVETKEGYLSFMYRLLSHEVQGRKERLSDRLLLKAGFDYIKSLDDIEYEFNPSMNYQYIKDLGTLSFMDGAENIIIIGPPGVGKSMIATGIGVSACKAGKKVLFCNAKELMDDLYESMEKGILKQELKKLSKIELLIIDELSYLKMDRERESIFFRLSANDTKKAPSLSRPTFHLEDGTKYLPDSLQQPLFLTG